MRRELFGDATEGLEVFALEGRAARHHLARTACGLDSQLPGDRDVAAQLTGALRRAESAGTAAGRAHELVHHVLQVADEVGRHTSFGRFTTGYCAAALGRIREVDGLHPASLRHVTIGGSTTSRSVLCTLRTDHGVPPCQLAAVYRDHHGQMKQLRAALAGGRRLRVHGYADERVLAAIEDADLVYLGIDHAERVLSAAALDGLRDYRARPLTIVDFNSHGSLDDADPPAGVRIWTARDIDDAVAAHAAITTSRAGFADAVREAEAWIERRVSTGARPDPARRGGDAVPV
jgi:glutamyl-tRNA reductase